jgi:tRNA pseudouridine55 synthase
MHLLRVGTGLAGQFLGIKIKTWLSFGTVFIALWSVKTAIWNRQKRLSLEWPVLLIQTELENEMFASLNVYKPLEITSHDVISRLRRVFGLKRIGHLGTLDPLAEGVLPVCMGQATRLIEYFPSGKRYTASVTLGRTTTTLDREGEELSLRDCTGMDLSAERLDAVFARFTGTILQQVPLYSAVHVGGKKLYELARKGQTAELPTRETVIEHIRLLEVKLENPAHPVLKLDVKCGSGTYIRSLARDIGEALGCGAFLSGLVRTEHGRFSLETAIPLEQIQQSDNPQQYLLDPLSFLDMPVLNLTNEEDARRLGNGLKIDPSPSGEAEGVVAVKLKPNAFYMAVFQEQPLGVVQAVEQRIKPVKIFPRTAG